MATDLTIPLPDRPGTLTDVARALGGAGVNIEGGCATIQGGRGVLHVLVEDAELARRALSDTGFAVTAERTVIVRDVEDVPGELADITERVADAGVNLELFYVATGNRIVLAAEDSDALAEALAPDSRA